MNQKTTGPRYEGDKYYKGAPTKQEELKYMRLSEKWYFLEKNAEAHVAGLPLPFPDETYDNAGTANLETNIQLAEIKAEITKRRASLPKIERNTK
jgi:hypothetical protein